MRHVFLSEDPDVWNDRDDFKAIRGFTIDTSYLQFLSTEVVVVLLKREKNGGLSD